MKWCVHRSTHAGSSNEGISSWRTNRNTSRSNTPVNRSKHVSAAAIAMLAAALWSHAAVREQPYQWRNVEIGGGGFVTGTIFHPKERGLVYARTDVGGAYRMDPATGRWIALNDDIGGLANEMQHLGVMSLALDPNDANRVYLATGQYAGPESWKLPARLYRSTDRGQTWTYSRLSFKMAGNGEGRGTGERLVVDPLDGANLFVGSNDAGLWRSQDHGASWARVASFQKDLTNFTFLAFAPANHANPGPSRRLYAAVNTLDGRSLWFSDDLGANWTGMPRHPGSDPKEAMMPLQGSFGADGVFYTTWADATGPTRFAKRHGVWKLSADGGTWTRIQPPGGQGFFAGIGADPRVAGHALVSTMLRWWPGDEVYRTTDGGTTWTPILRKAVISPGNSPWSARMKPHWISDIEIDPFDSNHAIFNTGFGLFRTVNLSQPTPSITWTFSNDGLEETVPHGLLSPADGPPLVSVIADFSGFRHDSLRKSPPRGTHEPASGSTSRISGAGLVPSRMIRQNRKSTYFSLDGGSTWAAFAAVPTTAANGHNRAVFSADGRRVLWCPEKSSAYLSTDGGATWSERKTSGTERNQTSGAAPAVTLFPCADRVDPALFYLWDAKTRRLGRSSDGGETFTPAAARELPPFHELRAVPGHRGHLWARAGNQGLHRSTDCGASFIRIPAVEAVHRFDFGKPKPGARHPAVFIWGSISGTTGIFRSDDEGNTWIRINDDKHQFGHLNDIAGDPRVYGQVFLGTSGRGVIVGAPPAAAR